MDRIKIHPDYRGLSSRVLEQQASRLRYELENPTPSMIAKILPKISSTSSNTLNLVGVTEGHKTLDDYVSQCKARTIAILENWIDTDLLKLTDDSNTNVDFLSNVGVANIAGGVNLSTLYRGHGAAWGGRSAVAFVPSATPLDLSKKAFKQALSAHINSVTTCELSALDDRISSPSDGSMEYLFGLYMGVKSALIHEIEDWIDALINPPLPSGSSDDPNHNFYNFYIITNYQILSAAVANGGRGSTEVSPVEAASGRNDRRPNSVGVDDFKSKLHNIVTGSRF